MPLDEVPVFQEPEYSSGGPSWLWRYLADAAPNQVRGIKRPDYLCQPESPQALRDSYPKARLLAVLREPVSRTISAYFHYMRKGHIPILPPEDGLRQLLRDGSLPGWPRSWEVFGFSEYSRGLKRYLSLFERDRILVLFQEELVAQPERYLPIVYEFLGVDSSFKPPSLHSRELPTVYSLPRLRSCPVPKGSGRNGQSMGRGGFSARVCLAEPPMRLPCRRSSVSQTLFRQRASEAPTGSPRRVTFAFF